MAKKTTRAELLKLRKDHARIKIEAYRGATDAIGTQPLPSSRYLAFSDSERAEIVGLFPQEPLYGSSHPLDVLGDFVTTYWSLLASEHSDFEKIIFNAASLTTALRELGGLERAKVNSISESASGENPSSHEDPTPKESFLLAELAKTNWIRERDELFLQHTTQRVERLKICAELAQMRRQAPRRGTQRDSTLENLVLGIRNTWVNYLSGADRQRYMNSSLRQFIDTVVTIADPHVTQQMIDTALRKIDRIPPRHGKGPPD